MFMEIKHVSFCNQTYHLVHEKIDRIDFQELLSGKKEFSVLIFSKNYALYPQNVLEKFFDTMIDLWITEIWFLWEWAHNMDKLFEYLSVGRYTESGDDKYLGIVISTITEIFDYEWSLYAYVWSEHANKENNYIIYDHSNFLPYLDFMFSESIW